MKMQSTNDSCNFNSKDIGGQEETMMQNSYCCSKCRFRWRIHTLTLGCVCVIIVCLFTVGYTTYRCEMIEEDFISRILQLEKKLDRRQQTETIARASGISPKLHNPIIPGGNGEENQTTEHSIANIHKRSTNKCNKAKTEKKRRKCLRRERRMKKEGNNSLRQGQTVNDCFSVVRNVEFIKGILLDTPGVIIADIISTLDNLIVKLEATKQSRWSSGEYNVSCSSPWSIADERCRSSFIQFEIDDGEGPVGFGGRFQSWRYSDWAYERLDQKSKFMLNYETGNVLIKEVGLYLVYAQVTFMDTAYNGFTIVVEDETHTHNILTKCMMGFTAKNHGEYDRNTRLDRRMTCSSVGIYKLEEGDQVFLRSTGTVVKIDHNSHACIFGFVKLV